MLVKTNKSIREKIVRTFTTLLLVTSIMIGLIAEGGLFLLRSKSERQLIFQASSSADVLTKGQAQTISEQITNVITSIRQLAKDTEYLYAHQEEYPSRPLALTLDMPDEDDGDRYYWMYFTDADRNRADIYEEASLLANLESEFISIKDTSPMIARLFAATTTHINLAYDNNYAIKKDFGAYDPAADNALWYLNPKESGKIYISEAKADYFTGLLMVTIAVPYQVDGEFRGVVCADMIVKDIFDMVLSIDMGTEMGYGILFSETGTVICSRDMTQDTTALDLLGTKEAVANLVNSPHGFTKTVLDNRNLYVFHRTVRATGWKLAIILAESDIIAPAKESDRTIFIICVILIVLVMLLLLLMIPFVNKCSNALISPLLHLTKEIETTVDGNYNYVSDIQTGDEIQALSEAYEKMTKSLIEYIENLKKVTAEKERIGTELAVATHIQSSMLPCIFPAFPDRPEIDIYATMNPAYEVGGDFYDFFMVDDRHVAIVIADVSGKGVPAALFMVIGKTLIKDHTKPGCDLGDVFTEVNEILCESNQEGFFITAYEGVLDLDTGEYVFVNAGHETPFLYRADGRFELYKDKSGFVLAGMEGMKYKSGSLVLHEGDKIFQYTDGVTEATNADDNLFGMARLEESLNKVADKTPCEILPAVKRDIDSFVGNARQFDDITMLCLTYRGHKPQK